MRGRRDWANEDGSVEPTHTARSQIIAKTDSDWFPLGVRWCFCDARWGVTGIQFAAGARRTDGGCVDHAVAMVAEKFGEDHSKANAAKRIHCGQENFD